MTSARAAVEIRPVPIRHWFVGTLVIAAAAALLAWTTAVIAAGDAVRAGLALPLLLPIVAAAAWRGEERGRLVLDGGTWRFEDAAVDPAGRPGELVVAMDLGSWMLLCFHPSGARWPRNRRWLALGRRDMPAAWQAFRRAVYSPRPPPAGPSAQAPADPPA